MNDFSFAAASGVAPALSLLQSGKFIAGGTNILDLMKENLMRPHRLVDINELPNAEITMQEDGSLSLGALARNASTAYHPLVEKNYPLLSAAILAGASPQIRNMASNGGNLLQRTRCIYFYDAGVPCNKRVPGSGCSAIGGIARQHAILGASDECIATHPSDMCVALAALDASVHVESTRGKRQIAFADFHRLPEDTPDIDTTLEDDELITHISLPPGEQYVAHSAYLKLRDRASYAFALVSVAAAIDLGPDGRVRSSRLALGGVAHKPWRIVEAEEMMVGLEPSLEIYEKVASRVLEGAAPQGTAIGSNAFKIEMAKRAIVRAFDNAMNGIVTITVGSAREQTA